MATSWCDFSDMPIATCAHCRPAVVAPHINELWIGHPWSGYDPAGTRAVSLAHVAGCTHLDDTEFRDGRPVVFGYITEDVQRALVDLINKKPVRADRGAAYVAVRMCSSCQPW